VLTGGDVELGDLLVREVVQGLDQRAEAVAVRRHLPTTDTQTPTHPHTHPPTHPHTHHTSLKLAQLTCMNQHGVWGSYGSYE
jgi:hypothetical protein